MHNQTLYDQLKEKLSRELHLLEDKPEETPDSTLHALWHLVTGSYYSAETALNHPLPSLSTTQEDKLKVLIEKRLSPIPLAHITGRQNFMGIELITDKRALIPRKETEILGKRAQELINIISSKEKDISVIDVCCGSGNLATVLALKNPNITVQACDLSEEALELTRENIGLYHLHERVEIKRSDVLEAYLNPGFLNQIDLIVCNPPYISSGKVSTLNAEIANHEPDLAFDGGMMGIKIIQKLIREAAQLLGKNAFVVLEVGLGQGKFIMGLFEKSKLYHSIESVADTKGNIRVISAAKI
ncbi:MAG: peptide chain release factor N(5)-glutamine methyltransferase [Bacteroidales bacterium]|nr:peptide chain release factor N(5)-glutamine methyltransferase [Bacteroidales bacterium]